MDGQRWIQNYVYRHYLFLRSRFQMFSWTFEYSPCWSKRVALVSSPLSVTSSLLGANVPLSDFLTRGLKEVQHRWQPLAAKTQPCHARGSNRQQHLRLACAFHYSWSWYAPLRQSTAVMRLKTAEQSAQLLTALVLRVRRESHACVWNIVRSLASVAIIMRDCRMPLMFASAVFRCECDPLPTNPWGGLSITCQRDSHRWWESFQIPTFWSFYTHWAQWCLWCVAGGYAVTRLLCFHYVVELFVLDCAETPQMLAN